MSGAVADPLSHHLLQLRRMFRSHRSGQLLRLVVSIGFKSADRTLLTT
jgi:hypothetical protein